MASNTSGWGLFILRLITGAVFAAHGAQKFFGTFGGKGLQDFGNTLAGIGFKPAIAWAIVVATVEFLGGLFLIMGILTRIAAGLQAVVMAVAIVTVHLKGGFFMPRGIEFPLILLAATIALAMCGPGNAALKN